jgi:CBS domain-containing protein
MKQLIRGILAEKGYHVETIGPDATVADAVRCMNERRIGSLLVVEDGEPAGIFTERDVLVRVIGARRDVDHTRVADVMTTELIAIEPTCTVEEAMVIVTQSRCRHLPVIEDGELVGLVSSGDLTRSVIMDQQAEIRDLVTYITWS